MFYTRTLSSRHLRHTEVSLKVNLYLKLVGRPAPELQEETHLISAKQVCDDRCFYSKMWSSYKNVWDQGMRSLQVIRAICLVLKTVILTVQMLTDSFINMHFFYRQCGLQAFSLSADHWIFCIHHWTVPMTQYLPISQNSGQMLLHFFQQEVKCTFPHTLVLKRIFSWVRGEDLHQWQSYHRLFWYLHQMDLWITSLFCTRQCHEVQPGSTS